MRRVLALLLTLLTVFASPASAAITLVQSNTNTTPGAATFEVPLSPLTTGNKVICQMKTSDETKTFTATATDVSFSTAVGPIDDPGAANIRTYQFYGSVTTGGAVAVVFTASTGTPTSGAWCAEFSGLAAAAVLDQTGSGVNASGTAHDISGTVTTTVATELLMGGCGVSGTPSTWSVGAGYTGIYTLGLSPSIPSGQFRVVVATGSYSSPMTSTNATASVCLLGTYKSDGSVQFSQSRSLLGVGQ